MREAIIHTTTLTALAKKDFFLRGWVPFIGSIRTRPRIFICDYQNLNQ